MSSEDIGKLIEELTRKSMRRNEDFFSDVFMRFPEQCKNGKLTKLIRKCMEPISIPKEGEDENPLHMPN